MNERLTRTLRNGDIEVTITFPKTLPGNAALLQVAGALQASVAVNLREQAAAER